MPAPVRIRMLLKLVKIVLWILELFRKNANQIHNHVQKLMQIVSLCPPAVFVMEFWRWQIKFVKMWLVLHLKPLNAY